MDVVDSLKYLLLGTASFALLGFALYTVWRNHRSLRDATDSRGIVATELAKATIDRQAHGSPESAIPAWKPPFQLSEYIQRQEPQEAELHIYSKIALLGPTTANVTVHKNGSLILLQICVGDVYVRAGGELFIMTTVVGNVTNDGGSVHVFAQVAGQLETISGETLIHKIEH
jgi:hypothetical protein